MATKIIEIPEDELRKIHSRLDVHKQSIERIAIVLQGVGYSDEIDEILEILEESQNPFEASDD